MTIIKNNKKLLIIPCVAVIFVIVFCIILGQSKRKEEAVIESITSNHYGRMFLKSREIDSETVTIESSVMSLNVSKINDDWENNFIRFEDIIDEEEETEEEEIEEEVEEEEYDPMNDIIPMPPGPYLIVNNILPKNIRFTKNAYIVLYDNGMYDQEWLNDLANYINKATEADKESWEYQEAVEIYKVIAYLLTAKTGYGSETVVDMMAKIMRNEIGGLGDRYAYQNSAAMEKAAVIWSIFNRVDSCGTDGYIRDFSDIEGLTEMLISICKSPAQFAYHSYTVPTQAQKDLTTDVIIRWVLEHWGYESGRVLPLGYRWFLGDGTHNHFRNSYRNGQKWTWDEESPYIED